MKYGRINFGKENVHIAWPTCSGTSSVKKAAKTAARLAPQLGQKPLI
jgi:hypothetical protein